MEMLNNLKLLGYKVIKYTDGDICAKSPSKKLIIFDKSLDVICSDFDSVINLAKGVYMIENKDSIMIYNKKYGNIELDNKYKGVDELTVGYIGNHYICEDSDTQKVEIYNVEGSLIACVEEVEVVNVTVDNNNKLHIFLCSAFINSNYELLSIDIENGGYVKNTIEYERVSYSSNLKRKFSYKRGPRYFYNNKLIIPSDKAVYLYDVEKQESKELLDLSCYEYPRLAMESWSAPMFYSREYIIVHNTETNRYYLMDEKGNLKYIDTTLTPLVYYKGYYIARDNKTIAELFDTELSTDDLVVLDSDLNIISKPCTHIEFLNNDTAILLANKQLTILNLKTLGEKFIADNILYYNLMPNLDEIYVGSEDANSNYCVNLNGEVLYTIVEYNELIDC